MLQYFTSDTLNKALLKHSIFIYYFVTHVFCLIHVYTSTTGCCKVYSETKACQQTNVAMYIIINLVLNYCYTFKLKIEASGYTV